jgi:cyanophycinase
MSEGVSTGPVYVVGGGMQLTGRDPTALGFVRASGGPDAKIAVVPTASKTWRSTGRQLADAFEDAGARETRVILVRDRYDAASPDLTAELDGVTGVFFSGGDQNQLVRALHGSPFLNRLRGLWRQGVAVGGTSAGASAVSATMISSGRRGMIPHGDMVTLAQGLGFLERVIVDQHFGRRSRLGRLLVALNRCPGLTCVGLCEDTALEVRGDGWAEVIGAGAVFVLRMDTTPSGRANTHGLEGVGPVRLHVLVYGDSLQLW